MVIYKTPARDDSERLARLVERRRTLPQGLLAFPEPPAYLSPHEREVWRELRGALDPTGSVGADQFAAVEGLACSIAAADRLREHLNQTPVADSPRRIALRLAIEAQDATSMRWIEFLGLTRAMRIRFATYAPGAIPPDRLGLEKNRR